MSTSKRYRFVSAGPRLTTGAASMFEDKVLERHERVPDSIEIPQTVPASREPGEEVARVSSPHESPATGMPGSPLPPETAPPQATSKERKAGFLRRRPLVSALGVVLLASAIAGGGLYWDN